MFGGEAHDSIVRGGGVPDRPPDTVAAREGLVACARPRSRVVASIGPRRLCGRSASSRRLGRCGTTPSSRPRRPRPGAVVSRPKVTLMFTPSTRPRRDERGRMAAAVIRTRQGAADERGLRRFAARRRGPDRARHPRAAVRERRRGAAPRRRDGRRVVTEDEVETFCFGPLRRVRDLLGLEQHEDLCCFSCFFRASLCVCFCDLVTL